jgi:glycosyltransferase involved in cell wall biosynthesis
LRLPEEKRIFIFLDTMPQRQGSGASLRYYSNVRAYLDLGYAVEVIQIATAEDGSEPSDDLRPVEWSRVVAPAPAPSLLSRLMFRAGIPHRAAVEYYFQKHRLVSREVEARLRQAPAAVYHFEGESIANVAPWLPRGVRSIWSLHDLPSTVSAATARIACEAQRRAPSGSERRDLRFARRVERFMARHAPLILCIAEHDSVRLRDEWGCRAAEYLPMSIPGDGGEPRAGGWLRDGRLRLLHLGSVSHLPSYRSLEFLFERVFPLLPARALARISLDVVGRADRANERTKRILALAEPYPNVSFRGFVDDVAPYYRDSDVQVVASTDASGLRTRTIESFAYGLPVLSTSVGARGIKGLRAGEDLMIADEAPQFAESLSRLLDSPETLERFSLRGRDFYERNQSRAAVASALSGYLQQYFGLPAQRPEAVRAGAS